MLTTGPNALNAFLRQKCERETKRSMRVIACNVQELQAKLSQKDRAAFDVISFDSCSWIKPEALWVAPQVKGLTHICTLPIMRLRRRVLVKRRQPEVRCTNKPLTEMPLSEEEEKDDVVIELVEAREELDNRRRDTIDTAAFINAIR